jgi:hypothetical protein
MVRGGALPADSAALAAAAAAARLSFIEQSRAYHRARSRAVPTNMDRNAFDSTTPTILCVRTMDRT